MDEITKSPATVVISSVMEVPVFVVFSVFLTGLS